ncbi:protein of unknown function [Persephonella hydrogeniphila]|uniref:Uncharacterized protein n=1 Tax=Persephonella hydrogeniphila TaxID=198703 RepID=A0A285NGV1_9AQUI|nr:DUF4105 domain-containing protein [Persephonella hydrogeniphila]SNZ07116.1 protein of unknown function [Persephonella hydrogeniphila]
MVQKIIRTGFLACLFTIGISFSQDLNKISHSAEWLSLLHYKDGKSEIDDPAFFISQDGNKNPLKELAATIKAFETSTEKGDDHPVCKYPARYLFLSKKVKIKLNAKPECKKFKEFIKEINPYSVSIIFSDAYINSPASMYGHTFIRIDPPVKSRLLGYAVNYAAHADQSEGFKYYLKGIFGLYKGFFSVFPYYKKIFEYNNLESRDLWEYSLDLPKEKIKLLTFHLWELKDRYTYYYFFNKNCSYQILHLIDIANPELKSVYHFNYWTIPVDTIRFLKKKGLIKSVYYRPSATSRIKEFIKINPDITEKDITLSKDIASFKTTPENILKKNLSIRKKAQILELSKLIFMYYSIKERMPYKEYRKKFLTLLKARSRVRYIFHYKPEKKTPPDEAHKSQLISFLTGTENGKIFISVLYRGAYHGLEDKDEGYIFGSEVLFPYFEVRNIPDRNKTVLNQLSFISIKSYALRDVIFKPVSWMVSAGIKRDWIEQKREQFFGVDFGMGVTYGKEGNYFISGMLKTAGQIGVENAGNSRIKLGTETVFLKKFKDLKILLSLYPFYALGNKSFYGYNTKFIANYPVQTDSALQIKLLLDRVFYRNRYEISFSVNRFF